MNFDIVLTEGPCGHCPVQAEGTIDGFPFYFRARWDAWSLRVAAEKNGDPILHSTWMHEEEYPGGGEYGAGYASKEECVEFINKCAKLWAERKVEEGE